MSVTGCGTGNTVPDVQIHREIPFLDAPEAVYVWTASHREGFMSAQEWKEKRPYMLCVDENGWAEIKKGWLKACRIAGPDCNVMVDSVDKVVRELDAIARGVMNGRY